MWLTPTAHKHFPPWCCYQKGPPKSTEKEIPNLENQQIKTVSQRPLVKHHIYSILWKPYLWCTGRNKSITVEKRKWGGGMREWEGVHACMCVCVCCVCERVCVCVSECVCACMRACVRAFSLCPGKDQLHKRHRLLKRFLFLLLLWKQEQTCTVLLWPCNLLNPSLQP